MDSQKTIIALLAVLIVISLANLGALVVGVSTSVNPQKTSQITDELPSEQDVETSTTHGMNPATVPTATDTTNTAKVSNILDASKDDLRGAYSYTSVVTAGTLYTSSIYSFSVVLPSSWGLLHEEVKDGPTSAFEQIVRVSSMVDSDRYIDIYVVKSLSVTDPSVVDLPAVKVGEISNRYIYLISSGADMYGMPGMDSTEDKAKLDEVNKIRASFKTAI